VTQKGVVATCFKILSEHSFAETEEIHGEKYVSFEISMALKV
jgi:hypothetical protein